MGRLCTSSSLVDPRIITSFSRRCSLNYWNPRGSVLSRAERTARSVNFQGSSFIIYVIITWNIEARRRHEPRVRICHSCQCTILLRNVATKCAPFSSPLHARGRIAGHVHKGEVHLAVMCRVSYYMAALSIPLEEDVGLCNREERPGSSRQPSDVET